MSQNSDRNWFGIAIVAVIVLILVSVVFEFWLAPLIFTEQKDAGRDIVKNVMDEDAIQDYRWFREQWYDIEAQRAQIENYRAEDKRFHETWGNDTDDWERDTRISHNRIHKRITGARNQLENMIAEYNARSDDATRAIFACGLPYNVDQKLFIGDATGVEYTSQEARDKRPPENPEDCQYSGTPPRGTVAGE